MPGMRVLVFRARSFGAQVGQRRANCKFQFVGETVSPAVDKQTREPRQELQVEGCGSRSIVSLWKRVSVNMSIAICYDAGSSSTTK